MKRSLARSVLDALALLALSSAANAKEYLEIQRDQSTLTLIDRESITMANDGSIRYLSYMLIYLDVPPGEFNAFEAKRWEVSAMALNCQERTSTALGIFANSYPDGRADHWRTVAPKPTRIEIDNASIIAKKYRVLCREEPVQILDGRLDEVMSTYRLQAQSGMLKK